MPTYSYRCTECGTAFDAQQAFTDDALTVCPNCGGRLRKLYGSVGVTFNGSGFYRTDSRAKPAEAKAGAKLEGSATTSATGAGSSSSSSGSTNTSSGSTGSSTSTASGSGSASSS